MTAKKDSARARPGPAAREGARPKGRTVHVRESRATSEPEAVTASEADFGAFLEALAEEGGDVLEDEAPDEG